MDDIDTTIKDLKSSPLFFLFLSSRELFHSNFWFWLSTLKKTETLRIFSDKTIDANIIFKREHKQSNGKIKATVDLYVSDKIAIENKVKDFPTVEQLERIKNSFGKVEIEFVLTTLFWTNDLSFDGWKVKTYKEISGAILPEKFTEDPYYQSLIWDYKRMTFNLAKLAEQLEIRQEYDFAISMDEKKLFPKLNEIKLWEGYQKLRASHLQFHFTKFNKYKVSTGYSINNQRATIDFYLDLHDSYRLGIQIEDSQYRKFVVGEKAGKFAENLINNKLFLNNNFTGRGQKKYLNYGEIFKYQYEEIEKMPFEVLFDKINDDFGEIINDIEYIKRQIPSS